MCVCVCESKCAHRMHRTDEPAKPMQCAYVFVYVGTIGHRLVPVGEHCARHSAQLPLCVLCGSRGEKTTTILSVVGVVSPTVAHSCHYTTHSVCTTHTHTHYECIRVVSSFPLCRVHWHWLAMSELWATKSSGLVRLLFVCCNQHTTTLAQQRHTVHKCHT